MADTSVEPKGPERTAESVRRREAVPLPLPSSDRHSSGVSDLGSICVGQDGEANQDGVAAVDGGPAQAPQAPAEGFRGQGASRSPPLPCTHRDPPTARAPKSPSTARAPLSRRVPTMPFPAPVPFPATPSAPSRGAHGLLMDPARPSMQREPSRAPQAAARPLLSVLKMLCTAVPRWTQRHQAPAPRPSG